MIFPPSPCRISSRPTACANRNAPVRLTSITFCQPSSGTSSGEAPHDVPELFTRMSTRPSSSTVRVTTAWIDSGSRTSQPSPSARTPRPEELGGRLLAALGVARAHDEVGAELGERVRDLPAEPAAAAGDDGDLPLQVEELLDAHSAQAVAPADDASTPGPGSQRPSTGVYG